MNNIFTRKKFFPYLIIIFLIPSAIIFSQGTYDPSIHHEISVDKYVPDLREVQERSPGYYYSADNITTVQVNVDVNGLNIVGDAANEPSIAIDPNNFNRMAIGWRQFNSVSSNFRQAGYGFTTDRGASWRFPGVIEPGIFRSDPVLESDVHGNFFYNSLTSNPDFFCNVFKSTDGGATWDAGVFAQGGDKQWMTIDQTGGPGTGNMYAFWTSFYSICSPNSFTRSANNGASFEDCISIPSDPYWGTLTIGPDGELYIGGSTGMNFVVAKSVNAQLGGPVSWDMASAVNLDGSITAGDAPNPGGLLGQTIIATDTSGGAYHGNVYLLCTVARNSVTDPADIMFVRSTNGGVDWSAPVRINDDLGTSAYQWFGTMSVAPNGRIDAVWLDTRDNPENISALYYSNSKDGGVTWSENVRLSEHFNSHLGWPNQNKMGDYFDMISDNSGAYLAWTATFNGEQDVYFSYFSDTTGNIPVELISFSSSVQKDVVTLIWYTATELNNYGFEIERSSDKKNWGTIGFREGEGTTSERRQYFYTDKVSGIEKFKLYYRLKQIDFNGKFEYSDIIEVDIPPAEFALLQNYPNPFNPVTKIKYTIPHAEKDSPSLRVVLKVFDVLGNEITELVNEMQQPGEYEVEFSARDGYASGIYYYQLRSGSNTITKKMMLMK